MTNWKTFNITTSGDANAIVIFASSTTLSGPASAIAAAKTAMESTNFEPKAGRWLDIIGNDGNKPRIVVIAVADAENTECWLDAGAHVVKALQSLRIGSAQLPKAADIGGSEALVEVLAGIYLHSFRFEHHRTNPDTASLDATIVIDPEDYTALEQARTGTQGANRARAWVEQPANHLTPAVFADEAKSALAPLGVQIRILGPRELEELGAGGILAVAAGSEEEPRLVVAEWRGAPDRDNWDAALVGKGLTFDAGGLNLKQRPIINKMKFDMAGAATVLGALECAAANKITRNIAAVVPMTENNIDGRAYRPGDVIRSMAGLTIDVQDTDAEGRIVLADGITYASTEYDPDCIVDVATLTGSIMSVLHEDFAGLFANDEDLANNLLAAGDQAYEHLWRLPLVARQDYLVESPDADVSNLAPAGRFGNSGGSPVAGAKFLQKFIGERPWAHLDIAGVAWATRRTPRSGAGATGFGVALLGRWLGPAIRT